MMSYDVLFDVCVFVFLGIFLAISILMIAALPGWIKIQQPYFGRLFAALVLQLVGSVSSYFFPCGYRNREGEAQSNSASTTAHQSSVELGLRKQELAHRSLFQ